MAATVAECPAILILTSRAEGYPLDQEWRAHEERDVERRDEPEVGPVGALTLQ